MGKSIKEKVKAKAKAVKEKLKGKAKRCAKCVALLFSLSVLAGCMTPEQASRSTHTAYGDIEPTVKTEMGAGACSNTVSVAVHITIGDGAIASTDSSGSTESQTQTPTFDISPKTDLRYNDALSAASTASKGVLETLTTAGANTVLSLMADKATGTVKVEKADGNTATVKCENGQCSLCTDCYDK
jgi:hypothetical protein